MENKDKLIKWLAALLLIFIIIAMWQRTAYENEIGSMKMRISSDSIKINNYENGND
jgi:hypothetical protein